MSATFELNFRETRRQGSYYHAELDESDRPLWSVTASIGDPGYRNHPDRGWSWSVSIVPVYELEPQFAQVEIRQGNSIAETKEQAEEWAAKALNLATKDVLQLVDTALTLGWSVTITGFPDGTMGEDDDQG